MNDFNKPCPGELSITLGPYQVRVSGAGSLPLATVPGTSAAAVLAVAPVLALLAAERGDVCAIGRLDVDGDGMTCVFVVRTSPSAPHVEHARTVVLRGTSAYHPGVAGGPARWLPIRRIDVCNAEGTRSDLAALAEADRVDVLLQAGFSVSPFGVHDGDGQQLTAEQRQRVRAAELEALVPLAKGCDQLETSVAADRADMGSSLRSLQESCLDLYGRLEPERALSWALEELGELAQAMRRQESSVRVEEELGQVLVWALCLANITRVDAAHAFAKAYGSERARQLRKYGAVHPYRRVEPSC